MIVINDHITFEVQANLSHTIENHNLKLKYFSQDYTQTLDEDNSFYKSNTLAYRVNNLHCEQKKSFIRVASDAYSIYCQCHA